MRNCPICESTTKVFSHNHTFVPIEGVSLLHSFNVCICGVCGMVYADKAPEQENIDLYYKLFSKYENSTADNANAELEAYHQKIVDDVTLHVRDMSSFVLDIGCGSGNILKKLKQCGFINLAGVELSETNCATIMATGIPAINKTLFELSRQDFVAKIECIIVSAVLEHVTDLRFAVRKIAELIDDDGYVFVSVPWLNTFKNVGRFPFEEFSMEHVNYFTLETLELLFRLNGFCLETYKENGIAVTAVFRKNVVSDNPLLEYIEQCNAHLKPTIQMINGYYQSQNPIVIYGCGSFYQHLLAISNLSKCNIKMIVDGNTNYHGHSLGNHIIQQPAKLVDGAFDNADIFAVSYHYSEEISANIRSMGLSNNIVSIPVR